MLSIKDDDEDDVDSDDVKLSKLSFTLRPLPDYLPCRAVIDAGRTHINIRALRPDEVVDFYAAMKEAAASGNGYGKDPRNTLLKMSVGTKSPISSKILSKVSTFRRNLV